MIRFLSVLLVLTSMTFLYAIQRPTGNEVKKVMNYYKNGKGNGAILVDFKFASTISKKEVSEEVDATKIERGDNILIWMNYLVPTSDTANIVIEFKRKGKVKSTAKLNISSATRYRTWKRLPTNKAGEWEIVIYQEIDDDNDIQLGASKYNVLP